MLPTQLQLSQLTELESHLANLGAAIPDLSQTTGYLEALSISSRPVQVRPQRAYSIAEGGLLAGARKGLEARCRLILMSILVSTSACT